MIVANVSMPNPPTLVGSAISALVIPDFTLGSPRRNYVFKLLLLLLLLSYELFQLIRYSSVDAADVCLQRGVIDATSRVTREA